MIAGVNLALDTEVAGEGGRIIVIGARGKPAIDPLELMFREVSIVGLIVGKTTDAEYAEMAKLLEEGIKNKTINPVIDVELPLVDAPKVNKKQFMFFLSVLPLK